MMVVDVATLAKIRHLFVLRHEGDATIARQLGMRVNEVTEIRRQHGIKGSTRPEVSAAMSDAHQASIRQFVAEGMSDADIAMRLGVSGRQVRYVRDKLGLRRNPCQLSEAARKLALERWWERKAEASRAAGLDPAERWATLLAGRRFANVDWETRIAERERSGRVPHREISTGNSSMAWTA